VSSAKARRLGEISLELWEIAAALNAKLRVLGDDKQADETLHYIKAKGISPREVYIALEDTYGAIKEEAIAA
jgi:hypothetical protein